MTLSTANPTVEKGHIHSHADADMGHDSPVIAPQIFLSLWKGLIHVPPRRATMREIAEQVARQHGLSLAHLVGPQRAQRYSRPRQEAMWRMCEAGRWSLPRIGMFFDRDHTTILHGRRAHQARLDAAAKVAAE